MHATFTPIIVTHLVAALAALALGSYVFLKPKGTVAHRTAGRVWAVLMLVTAVSTYWIRGNGSFSWIHILSVITVVVAAGIFTLLSQRLLGHAVWSTLGVI